MNEFTKISAPIASGSIAGGPSSKQGMDKNEIAMEFEQIFARQMVEQMTKNLFQNDNKEGGVLSTGGSFYKDHVVDALSTELAKQEPLGIAEIIRGHLEKRIEMNEPTNAKK
ncbi:MAG: hypothetical protein WD035_03490 [Balneolaceae bacterium]